MGRALAETAIARGHKVVIVSGPVDVVYPAAAEVRLVVSTEEMLEASRAAFETCDGLIGAAAPCDYRPKRVEEQKIAKTGLPLQLLLYETPDVVATLAAAKRPNQWVVGFALETEDHRLRALAKLERKSCDLIVMNGPQAMNAPDNRVEILSRSGEVLATLDGMKEAVADGILGIIERHLIRE
jgi:phosphopantothenoylcysteine decarboxylase/phosphopantothenate--cysteine ligase